MRNRLWHLDPRNSYYFVRYGHCNFRNLLLQSRESLEFADLGTSYLTSEALNRPSNFIFVFLMGRNTRKCIYSLIAHLSGAQEGTSKLQLLQTGIKKAEELGGTLHEVGFNFNKK